MRLASLTPGTGNFFCGNCLRDQTLARGLHALGHDVQVLPLYLPPVLEDDAAAPPAPAAPIFFGGVNCFLQQHSRLFRHTPAWLDRLLDHPLLLRGVARFAGMTAAEELGAMTWSMLQGEAGLQAKELARLVAWLRRQRPDLVTLSNGLLVGAAPRLRAELGVPVIATLQGEDSFLDALPDGWRQKCWELMAARCGELDALIVPTRYYAELLARRMGLAAGRFHLIPNGIDLQALRPAAAPPATPTLGFLSRLTPTKGLELVVDAYLLLHRQRPEVQLQVAGSLAPADVAYVEGLQQRLRQHDCAAAAEFRTDLTFAQKVEFLQGLTLLSVPPTFGPAFGRFLAEALACGVPVVEPRSGAFPELLELTGAGLLHEPDDPQSLAERWLELLDDPARLATLRQRARQAAEAYFSQERMAESYAAVCRAALAARPPAQFTASADRMTAPAGREMDRE